MTDTPSTSATAWQGLLDSLAEAGDIVTGPRGARSDRERAEGFRHLTRVLSIATEMLLEKGDPARPAFTRWMTPHRKMLGDNPYTIYDAAIIDADRAYRIRGRRSGPTYLGICVYGTGQDGARRIVGNLDDVDLTYGSQGEFEVWLAPPGSTDVPAGADRLELEPDTTDVMVRQYFADPPEIAKQASYSIQAVPAAGPPSPLTEDELAERLDEVGEYVKSILEVETSLSTLMASATPKLLRHGDDYVDKDGKDTDPPVDPAVVAKAMPTPAIQYSGSWFDDLGPDEAVVIEGLAPDARYWSVQLLTRWMESGDYVNRCVFLTGKDIELDGDGRFRVAVAHRDPGVPNWIDTTGLTSANIAVRALKSDDLLDVDFRRVSLDELTP